MDNLLKSRLPAFRHAFSGLRHVFITQKNAWIHAAATVLAISFALILKLPGLHIAGIILAIGLVWTAEIFNTSIEAVVDLVSPNHHPLAKIAKDTGAAAVLISAIISIIIGILLLGPPLVDAINNLTMR